MSSSHRPLFVVAALVGSFLVAQPASAVHDAGLFELDGNATASSSAGDDWSSLFPTNASSTVFNYSYVHEPASTDTTYFSVASKDINDVSTWSVNGNSAPPKDEIVNAFAAAYNSSTEGMILYFGADRWANNGDAAVGFWFLQGETTIGPTGQVLGSHVTNDTLVVSHFTNGGAVATIYVYKWVSSASPKLQLLTTSADCGSAASNDLACARVNTALTASALPYQGSGTRDPANQYPANSFFEGGIDLTQLFGGTPPCFSNFIAETRSSQETTATLKDVAFGAFNNCPIVPPQSAIVIDKVPLAPIVDLGQPIGYGMTIVNSGPDPAEALILWDELPTVTGTWTLGGANATACSVSASNNLTCAFGTLPVEDGSGIGTRYIEVTAGTSATTDCGYQPNTAFISANAGLANDQSSTTLYVWCSDVGVVKLANESAIDLGGRLIYWLNITSYGPDDAHNVTLTDALPDVDGDWWIGGAGSEGCTITADLLACDLGTLAAGASLELGLVANTSGAGDCGWQNNTATVSARVDTDGSNNASSASVYVRCSDIDVGKAPDRADVYLGGNVTFTITVASNGPDAATNVTVTDELPDPPGGWELATYDGTCAITGVSLSCDLGDIPVGQTRSVTVTALTSDPTTDCGAVQNTASGSADVDLDGTNNSATATETVRCSSVSIAKTAAASAVDVGGNVTYTVTVTSNGPDAAHYVNVSDALPALSGAWAFVPGQDESSCAIDAFSLTCAFGSLDAGVSRNVTVTSATGVGDCGSQINYATVTAAVDTTGGDNAANATEYVTCANVRLSKTASFGTTIDAGQTMKFTLNVTNDGPDAAPNVAIVDPLPTTALGWSIDPSDPACGISSNVLTCSFGTLNASEWREVSVKTVASVDDCGAIWNFANASADIDTDATDNAANASLYVYCSDVSIAKTAGGNISVGANATFTLTVTSLGPDAAENVTVSDTLPSGITWDLVATDDYASCGIASGGLTCDFGTVPASATRSVTITGATSTSDCAGVTNTASAWARLDTNASNNQSSAFVDVTCSDVSVAKTSADAWIFAGTNATWNVTITSLGPDDATNAWITDIVANGTVVALSGNASTYCSVLANITSCNIPTLAAGASLLLSITTSTTTGDCGTLRNDVTVGADVDTSSGNNAASATVEVRCPSNATRTQGFWSAHTNFTTTVFNTELGGSMTLGGTGHSKTVDTKEKLFGVWFSSIPYKSDGSRRHPVDQARMVLAQQLVAAKLNCAAFGCSAANLSTIAAGDAAYAGSNKGAMASAAAALDAYNNGGDGNAFPTTWWWQGPATPDASRALANKAFWDAP